MEERGENDQKNLSKGDKPVIDHKLSNAIENLIEVVNKGKFFKDKTEYRAGTINLCTYWEIIESQSKIES